MYRHGESLKSTMHDRDGIVIYSLTEACELTFEHVDHALPTLDLL